MSGSCALTEYRLMDVIALLPRLPVPELEAFAQKASKDGAHSFYDLACDELKARRARDAKRDPAGGLIRQSLPPRSPASAATTVTAPPKAAEARVVAPGPKLAVLLMPFKDTEAPPATLTSEALETAISAYRVNIARLIIRTGAYPSPATTTQKNLALIAAAKTHKHKTLSALLKSGANVNASVDGISPLMAAVIPDNPTEIDIDALNKGIVTAGLLLQHGANLYTSRCLEYLRPSHYPTAMRPAVSYLQASLIHTYGEARAKRLAAEKGLDSG